MPRIPAHWQQLELAGFRSRFSCCYPEEERLSPAPEHWQSVSVALPDHRNQEDLSAERLMQALNFGQSLLRKSPPVYLHCFAGLERSPLMAVGLIAQERGIDVFAALDWVRRCHPAAMPLYEQLVVLDRVLQGD
jgi:protein-tyrosine phosphatase